MQYLLQWILVLNLAAVLHGYSMGDAEALGVLKRVRRVIGGEGAEGGEWPYLVHLRGKVPSRTLWGIPLEYKTYHCGGSVLNKRWVLTAAHCFHIPGAPSRIRTPKYWHATIGEVDAGHSSLDRVGGFLARMLGDSNAKIWYIHATEIHWHPDYNSADNWKHDIALIRLEKDLPLDTDLAIGSITLPYTLPTRDWPQEHTECVMKGWGCVEVGGGVSEQANAVVLPVMDESTCSAYFGDVSSTRLCAGLELQNKGICPGDSGGPLVCKDGDGAWVQAGIASFTSRNNPGAVPGVFSRVSHYTDWIDSIMD